jgi:hypothetical protein
MTPILHARAVARPPTGPASRASACGTTPAAPPATAR